MVRGGPIGNEERAEVYGFPKAPLSMACVCNTHVVSKKAVQPAPKRLQVVLEEAELEAIQQAAEREEMTVSEWVRKALREARGLAPSRSKEAKLQAVRDAWAHDFPAGDIDQMLREIERGYLGGGP
jgi:ribbon-helix-helix CopG family protein